ncbi:Rossmann-like and DUF2520 domain-containing protein [Pollutibacter soli]|uniref:Rossmann-like and DUF2520 domain-containing protein n=1 Tax=Pollutibacter soli TaxID=3034157 RepID=UPI0030138FA7
MDIVIIGSGNVAIVFIRLISRTNHRLRAVVCRNPDSLSGVTLPTGLLVRDFGDDIVPADLYIAALSDQFLPELKDHIRLHQGIIVHTAGSVSKEVLKTILPRYGVIYPLQSLRKELDFVPEIPLLVDGSDPLVLDTVRFFAREISEQVTIAGDEIRSRYHLAAVSSANFINYLLILVYDYCEKEKLDADMLLPLLKETINRLEHVSPAEVQTGPAIRNDSDTISRHLDSLKHYPRLKKLYEHFTELISEQFRHKSKDKTD